MLNTKSTILENWPGPKTADDQPRTVYRFAIRQTGFNLDFHLEPIYRHVETTFHHFQDFDELVTICQRFDIDAIIIGGRDDFSHAIELVRDIKQNIFLAIIPVVLYHPEPDNNTILAAYENGAEEFVYGGWNNRLIQVRIRRLLERSRRDLSINPSSHLPGPSIIESEIARQIDKQMEFAVCYADLDNFKAFNDYYGYYRGDKVIRLTAKVVKDTVFDLCREGFVGHIAGDDFIYIIPADMIEQICRSIIKTFDSLIPYRYEPEDRERGYITTKSRRGDTEQFPLLTISIAVVVNNNGKFGHVGELSRMLADLKSATKLKSGSNFMVERRRKY
ncbi:MAG: diguanylate cyclase [candidate division Zixibacteria bacterium]|nr:diguanylate cyclase [candidate division Zixibacteria bacterium]MDH3938255.1 diguanylate cyclase [candidate division Zixibacteria bacterium]MDH4035277.1 diguanylate cyclase [candidate division Zixibacteria bacterium]